MPTDIMRFRKQHSLAETCDLESHATSIGALSEVNRLTTEWLGGINNKSGRDSFVVLAYMNLVSRIHEQASGMLVCVATNAWASAEALSRVVLESAVNLRCLCREGSEKSLLSFFDSWLDDHDNRLTLWRGLAEKNGTQKDLTRISERIDYVRLVREALDAIVEQLQMSRAEAPTEVWPNSVHGRFSLVGMEEDYRSTYHRMSSASHSLAEDTLNWLLLIHTPNSKLRLQAAGDEAVAYSVMLTRISLLVAVESMVACCISRGLTDTSIGDRHRAALELAIEEIAARAGVPHAD
ncbi:MAG: hypothetical protein DHS20C15_31470 [Planctomycetota bacterium]|nr:MAG: hypothetical protein DHS20C15_31470 [Planctomycetota bacterium]